jgi:hypothetical protein
MSQYNYIGTDRPLPEGSYGDNYRLVKHGEIPYSENDLRQWFSPEELAIMHEQLIRVYDTMVDFTYVGIKELVDDEWLKNELPIEKKYVYVLFGSFDLKETDPIKHSDSFKGSEKCFRELFNLLNQELQKGETAEVYTCWLNEMNEPSMMTSEMIVDLADVKVDAPLAFETGQLTIIKK